MGFEGRTPAVAEATSTSTAMDSYLQQQTVVHPSSAAAVPSSFGAQRVPRAVSMAETERKCGTRGSSGAVPPCQSLLINAPAVGSTAASPVVGIAMRPRTNVCAHTPAAHGFLESAQRREERMTGSRIRAPPAVKRSDQSSASREMQPPQLFPPAQQHTVQSFAHGFLPSQVAVLEERPALVPATVVSVEDKGNFLQASAAMRQVGSFAAGCGSVGGSEFLMTPSSLMAACFSNEVIKRQTLALKTVPAAAVTGVRSYGLVNSITASPKARKGGMIACSAALQGTRQLLHWDRSTSKGVCSSTLLNNTALASTTGAPRGEKSAESWDEDSAGARAGERSAGIEGDSSAQDGGYSSGTSGVGGEVWGWELESSERLRPTGVAPAAVAAQAGILAARATGVVERESTFLTPLKQQLQEKEESISEKARSLIEPNTYTRVVSAGSSESTDSEKSEELQLELGKTGPQKQQQNLQQQPTGSYRRRQPSVQQQQQQSKQPMPQTVRRSDRASGATPPFAVVPGSSDGRLKHSSEQTSREKGRGFRVLASGTAAASQPPSPALKELPSTAKTSIDLLDKASTTTPPRSKSPDVPCVEDEDGKEVGAHAVVAVVSGVERVGTQAGGGSGGTGGAREVGEGKVDKRALGSSKQLKVRKIGGINYAVKERATETGEPKMVLLIEKAEGHTALLEVGFVRYRMSVGFANFNDARSELGGLLTLNSVILKVLQTDHLCSEGVVRIIPAPLMPPLGAFGEAGLESSDLIFAVNGKHFGDGCCKWWEGEDDEDGMEEGAREAEEEAGGGGRGRNNDTGVAERRGRTGASHPPIPPCIELTILRAMGETSRATTNPGNSATQKGRLSLRLLEQQRARRDVNALVSNKRRCAHDRLSEQQSSRGNGPSSRTFSGDTVAAEGEGSAASFNPALPRSIRPSSFFSRDAPPAGRSSLTALPWTRHRRTLFTRFPTSTREATPKLGTAKVAATRRNGVESECATRRLRREFQGPSASPAVSTYTSTSTAQARSSSGTITGATKKMDSGVVAATAITVARVGMTAAVPEPSAGTCTSVPSTLISATSQKGPLDSKTGKLSEDRGKTVARKDLTPALGNSKGVPAGGVFSFVAGGSGHVGALGMAVVTAVSKPAANSKPAASPKVPVACDDEAELPRLDVATVAALVPGSSTASSDGDGVDTNVIEAEDDDGSVNRIARVWIGPEHGAGAGTRTSVRRGQELGAPEKLKELVAFLVEHKGEDRSEDDAEGTKAQSRGVGTREAPVATSGKTEQGSVILVGSGDAGKSSVTSTGREEGGSESSRKGNNRSELLLDVEKKAEPLCSDELVTQLNFWSSQEGLSLSPEWYRDFIGDFEKELEIKSRGSAPIILSPDDGTAMTITATTTTATPTALFPDDDITATTTTATPTALFPDDDSSALTAIGGDLGSDLYPSNSVSGSCAAFATTTAVTVAQSSYAVPDRRAPATPAAKRKRVTQSDTNGSSSAGGWGGGPPGGNDSEGGDKQGKPLLPARLPLKQDAAKRNVSLRDATKRLLERACPKTVIRKSKLKSKMPIGAGTVRNSFIPNKKVLAAGSTGTGGGEISFLKSRSQGDTEDPKLQSRGTGPMAVATVGKATKGRTQSSVSGGEGSCWPVSVEGTGGAEKSGGGSSAKNISHLDFLRTLDRKTGLLSDDLVVRLCSLSSDDGLRFSTEWDKNFIKDFKEESEKKNTGSAPTASSLDDNTATMSQDVPSPGDSTATTTTAEAMVTARHPSANGAIPVTAAQFGGVDSFGRSLTLPTAKWKRGIQFSDNGSSSSSVGDGDSGSSGGRSCGVGKKHEDIDDVEPATSPSKRDASKRGVSKRDATKRLLERARSKAMLRSNTLRGETPLGATSVEENFIPNKKVYAASSMCTDDGGIHFLRMSSRSQGCTEDSKLQSRGTGPKTKATAGNIEKGRTQSSLSRVVDSWSPASVERTGDVEIRCCGSSAKDNNRTKFLQNLDGRTKLLSNDELIAWLFFLSSADDLRFSSEWYKNFIGDFQKKSERRSNGNEPTAPSLDNNMATTSLNVSSTDNSTATMAKAAIHVTARHYSTSGAITVTDTQPDGGGSCGRSLAPSATKRKRTIQSGDNGSSSSSGGGGGGRSCGTSKRDDDVDDVEPVKSPLKRNDSQRDDAKCLLEGTLCRAGSRKRTLRGKTSLGTRIFGEDALPNTICTPSPMDTGSGDIPILKTLRNSDSSNAKQGGLGENLRRGGREARLKTRRKKHVSRNSGAASSAAPMAAASNRRSPKRSPESLPTIEENIRLQESLDNQTKFELKWGGLHPGMDANNRTAQGMDKFPPRRSFSHRSAKGVSIMVTPTLTAPEVAISRSPVGWQKSPSTDTGSCADAYIHRSVPFPPASLAGQTLPPLSAPPPLKHFLVSSKKSDCNTRRNDGKVKGSMRISEDGAMPPPAVRQTRNWRAGKAIPITQPQPLLPLLWSKLPEKTTKPAVSPPTLSPKPKPTPSNSSPTAIVIIASPTPTTAEMFDPTTRLRSATGTPELQPQRP